MTRLEVGVDIDDFRLGTKEGLRRAADLHFRVVEMATVEGELAPNQLSSSGRRHLARFVEGQGLRLGALVADMPGLHLADSRTVDERVERTLKIIDLAKDMNVPVVTSATGALTHSEEGTPLPYALEALGRIGEFADTRGIRYAIRPSLDAGDRVADFLDALGCPSIGLGLDPAAMVMTGANPLASIERLMTRITLLHARDATAGRLSRADDYARLGHETRLGEGEVDLLGLFAALRDSEYRGACILRRTDSKTPTEDLQAARSTIQRLL